MTCSGKKPGLDVVLSHHLEAYRKKNPLSAHQSKVLGSIAACRTAALGGHIKVCKDCGSVRVYYNSCRDRHCPKCQSIAKEQWLAARQAELLPIAHYHLVFTIPEELRLLFRYNERTAYDLLFRLSWSSLKTLCADERYLGGRTGALSVLHTWGQQLQYHPHVHCLVPAGGLSFDGRRWRKPRYKDYLVSVRALSRLFRGRMISALGKALREKRLRRPPGYNISQALTKAMQTEWVVYAKAPFAGAKKLLDYLARYVKRVAISNDRIMAVDDKGVAFNYLDYADQDRRKLLRLSGEAFIRRFVQHILPPGFMKVRYYGILAIRDRQHRLAKCHYLLGRMYKRTPAPTGLEVVIRLTGKDPRKCPDCGEARLILLPLAASKDRPRGPPRTIKRGRQPTPTT